MSSLFIKITIKYCARLFFLSKFFFSNPYINIHCKSCAKLSFPGEDFSLRNEIA